ncbi:MAG: NifB/NifX family molybdenum-iron cluster-binding protein [Thermanaeromonas sp.]|uniref:NifB/NifX family molybdenum-iron cluster-binding protein n=1 Tax=Thermanaeromonas sp. TaxID=2003697 RepID=UPI00243BE959|nr:NifB/NifX family molybdenum-iron cluster-binding protein [Thermanaeromonas sp.]MCG0278469.1 NifB/NifX family molybdenum-iron cluster-binding protein [Thermanaeromonas sp.]
MKIAVTAQGPSLEASVDPRFGRCSYFVIAGPDGEIIEAIPNDGVAAGGGAGISAAQLLINKGIEVLLTGQVGPNAMRVLQSAGIKIYQTAVSTVKAALEELKEGKATPLSGATVGPHFGWGRGGRQF